MVNGKPSTAQLEREGEAPLAREVERLQKELRRSRAYAETLEARLAQVHRLGKLVCWDWDATTGTLKHHGCPEAAAATGYAPYHEVERFTELVHPDDLDRVRAIYSNADETKSGYEVDYRFNDSQGRQIQTREVAEAVHDQEGRFVGHRGIIQDITEIQYARTALRQREAWLNQVQEFAGIGYWIWKGERIADWRADAVESGQAPELSDESRKIYGLQRDREGLAAARAHPDDRARCLEVWNTADRRQEGYALEYRLVHPDGSTLYLREVGQPNRSSETGKIVWFGIAQDISAYRKVEAELRESRERFQDLAESTTDWSWELDAELRFAFLSARYSELTGIDSSRFMGKRRWEIADDTQDKDAWAGHRADLEARRPVRNFRYPFWDAAGRRRFVAVSGNPKFDPDGNFTGYRGTATDVTVEVEARQALEESEARLVRAASMAKLGYWVWDEVADRPVFGSEIFLEIFGLGSSEEMTEKLRSYADVARMIHPDDRETYQRKLKESLRSGRELDRDIRIVRPDGTVRHLRLHAERISDSNGRAIRSEGIIQDISEVKQTEWELDHTRALLQAAIEQSPTGIIIADAPDGRISLVNPVAQQIRGIPEEHSVAAAEALSLEEIETFHPDGRPRNSRDQVLAQAVFDGRTSQNVESLVRTPDGIERRLLSSGAPVRDQDGRVIAGIEVFTDVTELTEVENALRRSEEGYRTMIDAMPVAVYDEDWSACKRTIDNLRANGVDDLYHHLMEDPDRVDQLWQDMATLRLNPAALAVYRADSHADLDRFFTEWDLARDAESRELIARYLDALASGAANFSGEVEHAAADGNRVSVRVSITIPDAFSETWERVVIVEEDVTRRKNTEAQLRQAQKMEAVGQLTGGVAHDFNNVLGIILGNLELINEQVGLDQRIGPHLRAAVRATERGAALTQRLLAFSRKQPLKPQPVDLSRLIQAVRSLAQQALRENIQIETGGEAQPWSCLVDPGQLENALLNLAINARDAMPEGGHLMIETLNVTIDDDDRELDLQPGDYVRITVADTGTGIPEETLDHVCEPFFTTKDVGKGSGLGLSMVYGFVKQSGGHVTIESRVNVGTTVRLYLPRFLGPPGTLSRGSPKEPNQGAHGEAILVVEDDPGLSRLLRTMLEKLNYVTFGAGSAEAALALLCSETKIDLLLTDIVLPGGVNGRQLASEAQRRYPDLPVLFMSGYSEDAAAHAGPTDSGEQLLQKPFRKGIIAAAVRVALDRQKREPRPS